LTSLLLITFVFLSITTNKVEGKRGDVEKVGKGQALGGAHTGKAGPGKAKLKLRKRKQKRRKAASKRVKGGKKEQKNKRRLNGKDSKNPSKRRKNNKQSPKDKKKKKNKKKAKKNDDRKLSTRKEKKKTDSEKEGSKEKEAARQIATADADPDRYKHCDYLDLVEVGYREDSICKPGDKMVFKGGKGIRRQFLMTPQTNVVVFLESGKKVTSCNNTFNDITSKVRCKPVNGVKQISSLKKNGVGGSTCSRCPSRQENCPASTPAPTTTGSDAEITCRCPPSRFFACIYKVESNGNSHTVTCNEDQSVAKIACGSDLVAKTTGSNPLERYSHPLCTTKEYTSILLDLTWSCKDKSIPVEACDKCDGTPCDENGNDETTADMSGSMSTKRPRRFQILK